MTIVPLATVAPADVESLLDRAFGPDRHARTAYRVRAGLAAIPALSFAMLGDDGALIASIQCWPVALACADGGRVPMVMVGPIAVEPAIQRAGLGQQITRHMLAAADAGAVAGGIPGADRLMLVGDPEYYARFFGFSAEHTARWSLPGPWEPRRLLARGADLPDCDGMVEGRAVA
ncbi:N-acetyltransferase [Sphingomonas sp.]|uniref:GNAT family N-acetyltransferase n=1 Tax=Sphingomonas sp. TaxID=28214 RepID=UPI002CC1BBEB|nr:N-acetyltransferase [Sphingomonas sp.]HWK36577.1 N-acetyltransferase [Sphingomonas sp.]